MVKKAIVKTPCFPAKPISGELIPSPSNDTSVARTQREILKVCAIKCQCSSHKLVNDRKIIAVYM